LSADTALGEGEREKSSLFIQQSGVEAVDQKTLTQIAAEQPFPDYVDWWTIGQTFSGFMSEAIVSQWSGLEGNNDLGVVSHYVSNYVDVVYGRRARASLADDFVSKEFSRPIHSGEFDALSYSFYRSAFESIEGRIHEFDNPLERERRLFTKRVGKIFFRQLHDYLGLELPANLEDDGNFERLKDCIGQISEFLTTEGYLRDLGQFTFSLDVEYSGRRIIQTEQEFLENLKRSGLAYAMYEMGYPAILPSAAYLYHTLGEAQHHSSRTIEELFELVGCDARETDDFDPIDYPADSVVELWEIRSLV
jgi:hypothetical protein